MVNKNGTRLKVKIYGIKVLMPISFVIITAVVYKVSTCNFSSRSNIADIICYVNWYDGLFLVCSYVLVKLISPIIGAISFLRSFGYTLVLYVVSYGIIAFPFLILSVFKPVSLNVFLHGLLVILIAEWLSYRASVSLHIHMEDLPINKK
jgi:hypothetical protein